MELPSIFLWPHASDTDRLPLDPFARSTAMSPPDDHDGVNRRSVLQGLSAGAIGAWISPLLAGSKTMPDTPADLILYNGRLHTVDRKKPQASAVAIKDGRFVVVGSDAQAMALQGRPRKSSTCMVVR
jgi:hypothetical protein